MHEFKHPKYYKELRKRNKELQAATRDLAGAHSDQAISSRKTVDVGDSVRPDPGLTRQASSSKHQATSRKPQAPSDKPQAPSHKRQA